MIVHELTEDVREKLFKNFIRLSSSIEEARALMEIFEEVFYGKCAEYEVEMLREIFGSYSENN